MAKAPKKGMNAENVRRKAEAAHRHARALELRAKGLTYQQIANEMGVNTPQAVRSMIQKAFKDLLAEPQQAVINLEQARLDMLWNKAMDVLDAKHLAIHQGQAIIDPTKEIQIDEATGKPIITEEALLRDNEPVLKAIQTLLKVAERRAALLGLDAPKRTEVSGFNGEPLTPPSITVNFVDPGPKED